MDIGSSQVSGPGMTMDESRADSARVYAARTAELHGMALAEQARQLLGYRQRAAQAYAGGIVTFTWRRDAAEQVAGLPVKLVEQARQAAAAEQEAARAVASTEQAVQAYAQKHSLSREAFNVKMELDTAELRTAHADAQRTALRVLVELGRAAADLADIRGQLAAIPGRIHARRQECNAAEHADISTQKELAARLANYGLLT